MEHAINHPIVTAITILFFVFCFWGGCFQGRALAAARQKRLLTFYRDEAEISLFGSFAAFFFLLVLPWGEVISNRGIRESELAVHIYLLPFFLGIPTGLLASRWFYRAYIKIAVAALLATIISLLFISSIPRDVGVTDYNYFFAICLLAITGVMVANNILLVKVGRARGDSHLTSLPEVFTSPETQALLELLSQDGELVEKQMRYSPMQLFPASLLGNGAAFNLFVEEEWGTTFAMLYLRVAAGSDDSIDAKTRIPKSGVNAAWFHIPWKNIERLEVAKTAGGKITTIVLRNSGCTIQVNGAPEVLQRYARLKSTRPLHVARPT